MPAISSTSNALCYLRLSSISLACTIASVAAPVHAQFFDVELHINQPKLENDKTVIVDGVTNLPVGTILLIRHELAGRKLPPVSGQPITSNRKAIVGPGGAFESTLRDPYGFKSGKYRLTVQAWACGHSVFGNSKPQPASFYVVAGSEAENLQGPLVNRKISGLSSSVSVTQTKEVRLSERPIEEVARREKRLFQRFSRAIDEAYMVHRQLLEQRIYARAAEGNDQRANRFVDDLWLRLKNFRNSIGPLKTQEAFFLFSETVTALSEVHVQAFNNKDPAAYAEAVASYKATKASLDAFISGIK